MSGMAVAAGGALVVPTVVDADSRPLEEIAVTTRALAARAAAPFPPPVPPREI